MQMNLELVWMRFCPKEKINPRVKIIHRVNDMDLGRYGSDPWRVKAYKEFSKHCDGTIFVSDWTREWFLNEGWLCDNTFSIYNGVDKEIFKPGNKIDNGKINIVTHHWSNNKGKGFDIYNKIDEFVGNNVDFTFTYIGRHQNSFTNTNCIDPICLAKFQLMHWQVSGEQPVLIW